MLPHNASSPIATHSVLLGSRNVVLEDVDMNAALRHDRQSVHEAKNFGSTICAPKAFQPAPRT